jgi:ABC-type multidrug transport system ATPase subunit
MKTTNETEMVTIGDGFTPEATKSIGGHLKSKQRPNVIQKYRFQCQSLVKKNMILMMRNKISTIAMLLAPAICILLFGLIVIDEKQREMKVISDPKDFFCLGEKCENAGATTGGEGNVLPKCLMFDRQGGKYGYGKVIPAAKCTSLIYAPSGNDEVKELMTMISKKSQMTHSSGGTSEVTVDDVLASDVYGMETTEDLKLWMQQEKNLGYVTAVVDFNASSSATSIGQIIKYDIWYNASIINREWYKNARYDDMEKFTETSSFGLQIQRSINEGILGIRNKLKGNSGNNEEASLTVRFKRFPEVPATKAFRNRLCDGDPSAEAQVGVWIFLAIMVDFLVAIITIVGEKEKGLLGAMRTVGVNEFIYWLSWLFYFGTILFFSILLLIIVGLMFGDTLPFFKYTEFGVLFPLLYVYGITMISIAFLFASCISRVQTATRIAGAVFGLGIVIVNFLVGAGPFLTPLIMDPLIFPPFWRGFLYGVVPPVAFGSVAQHITAQTMPSHRVDQATNETSYSSKLYTVANYTGGPLPLPENPNDNLNEYIYTNQSSLNCPIGTDPVKCYYHQIPMSEVIGPMYTMFFICMLLAWYFGQICTSTGGGRSQSLYFICDPRYWGCLKTKAKQVPFTDQDDLDENVKAENKRCREGDENLSAVRIADLVKQYGHSFKAVNGLCLSMEYGQIFALLGHNGAGKTTSIRMMTGLENVTSGEADVAGYDVSSRTQEVRDRIGICPQHDVLWPQLTAREHLEVYSMFKGNLDGSKKIDEILHGVKLYDVQNKQSGKFSGGMKRRLSVAISAMGNPDVIFLDEPTTGMDPMNKKSVWDMIQSLKKEASVVLTTHSMEEADALGDRIGIMSHGHLVALGTALELKTQHGSGYRVKLVTTKMGIVKDQVKKYVPNAELVDDSAGSLSYAIHKESMNRMPELFKWIEQNVGTEERNDSMLTDWAVSNTTLEEVFIQLARKEHEQESGNASSNSEEVVNMQITVPPQKVVGQTMTIQVALPDGTPVQIPLSAELEPNQTLVVPVKVPKKMPTVLNPVSDVDKKDDIVSTLPQTTVTEEDKINVAKSNKSRAFEALIRQRITYQWNQRRSNCKLCLCPLIAMFILLAIFSGLDALVKLGEERAQLNKNIDEENCNSCISQAKTFCESCGVKGSFSPGSEQRYEQMCFNHENGKVKYTFKNEWDEWNSHLNHVATQGFGFCQVCDYCSKNTYASVAAHTEDGTRQVQVGGNTTHPIMAERPWKKNWNGTRLDFANDVTLANSFGVAFNWLLKGTNGNYLNDFEGCDNINQHVCSFNSSAIPFSLQNMCSCDATKSEFKQTEDIMCFEGCMKHKNNMRGGLTDRLPFIIPETIDQPHQHSTQNGRDHQWFLINSVSTSARVGIVAVESEKAGYLGSKSGGLADTIEGARCWQHRDQDSLYKADEEHNGNWFPYTTNGHEVHCEFFNKSDSRIVQFLEGNGTWNEKQTAAINGFKSRGIAKFSSSSSGLVGQFPQNIIFVEDSFLVQKEKQCKVQGNNTDTWVTCAPRQPCTCVNDARFETPWDKPDSFQCADNSCTDDGMVEEACPAIKCADPEGDKRRLNIESSEGDKRRLNIESFNCKEEQIRTQRVYVSPTYVQYSSAAAINTEQYQNQQKVLDGTIAKMEFEDSMQAMEKADESFLSAAMIFNKIDATKIAYDVTFQSYFTEPTSECDFIYNYPMAALRKKQSDDADHVCNSMVAEWRSNPWFPPRTDPWNVVNSIYKFGGEGKVVGPGNWLLNTLSNGILRKQGLGIKIETGFKAIPFPISVLKGLEFVEGFKSFLASFFTQLIISIVLSPLLTAVIQEKELKLKAMMRMMGMEEKVYYIVTYLWNFLFAFGFFFWFWMIGVITGAIYSAGGEGNETIFTRTDGLIFIFLFIVYAHAQAMFIFLLTNFFHTAKKASSSGFFIMLGFLILTAMLNGTYEEAAWGGKPAPFYVMMIPPIAMFRAIYLLDQQAITWETLTVQHEISNIFGWMLLSSVLFFFLDNYLSNVMPRQYGTRRRWDYPFQMLKEMLKEKVHPTKSAEGEKETNEGKGVKLTMPADLESGAVHEDDDVTKERELVLTGVYNKENSKILTYDLNKMYGKFCAVKSVTFHVKKSECFGLLGPNGAGKTTTISMLTGLFSPSRGNASVSGYDLRKELKSIYDVMGICPQFDICWPDLNVEDHLYFYARLKGMSKEKEQAAVNTLINEVGLADAAKSKKKAKELSGGMRRRLSLAMSLIGEPEVVFLDEPTTGLDPETKRNIWALLDKVKQGRCIILTTHSMDEADALCERIGIMSHGLMRCVGTNLHLKNKYGNGYKIEIRFVKEALETANTFVMNIIPKATVLSTTKDTRVYQVLKTDVVLSEVFRAMQDRNDSIGILDYGVRQTSLEEVFLKIARESEAAFQNKNK